MKEITKQDFVDLGLSGGTNSSFLRRRLLQELMLPEHMSANAMLQALNLFYSKEELEEKIKQLEK
jgi:ribonuclease M5